MGNRWTDKKDGWTWDPRKAYIKEAVKNSLKRLQTDYIDLYQLHGGTIEDQIEETIEAFEELKEEGYIRYYGISSIRPNVIRKYVRKSNIVSVMLQYSILDRRPEEEILSLLHKNGISVVTRGSLAKGLLSKMALEKASQSVKENGYLDYRYDELEQLLPSLQERFSGRSLTEVAYQYVLSHPAVTSIVAGASSVEQLKENIQFIQSATKANKYTNHR